MDYVPVDSVPMLKNIAHERSFEYFNNVDYLYWMYKNHGDQLKKNDVFIVLQPDGHWQFIMPQSIFTVVIFSVLTDCNILIFHHSILADENGVLTNDVISTIHKYTRIKNRFYKLFWNSHYNRVYCIPFYNRKYDGAVKVDPNTYMKKYDYNKGKKIKYNIMNTMEIPMDYPFMLYAFKNYNYITSNHYYIFIAVMRKMHGEYLNEIWKSLATISIIHGDAFYKFLYRERWYGGGYLEPKVNKYNITKYLKWKPIE